MTFGEYMEANDIPRQAAAEALDITVAYVGQLARGKHSSVSLKLATKIEVWTKGAVKANAWL